MNIRTTEKFKFVKNTFGKYEYIFSVLSSYGNMKLMLYVLNIWHSDSVHNAESALQHVRTLPSITVRGFTRTERTDIKICIWKTSTSV
jgi:hypothetical protein